MKNSTIIILHGWGLSATHYKKLAKALTSKGFKVYVPDLPGFGKQKLDRIYNLSDYVGYLRDFLTVNKIEKAVVIGHSFGGRIAIKASVLLPGSFSALILTGVPGFSSTSVFKKKAYFLMAKAGKKILDFSLFNRFSSLARKIIYRSAGSYDYYKTSGLLRPTFQNIINERLGDYLTKIKIPVLLIWGKEDKIVSLKIAQKMHKIIAESSLIIIPEANHRLPYVEAEIFSDKVVAFIKKL